MVAAPHADVALAGGFQLRHGVADGGGGCGERAQRRFAETEVSYLVREQANCHTKYEFPVWGARNSEKVWRERAENVDTKMD